jgi:hypothetical protein
MEQADFGIALNQCVGEFGTLLTIANFTLWVGVIAAIVISVLTVAERIAVLLRRPATGEGAGGSAGVASFLDSLKGLIAALAASLVCHLLGGSPTAMVRREVQPGNVSVLLDLFRPGRRDQSRR